MPFLRRHPGSWIAAVLAAAAFVLPAHAGRVEVLVRERGALPIPDQPVYIHPPTEPGVPAWGFDRALWGSGSTDASGKVSFEGLPAGRYTITFGRIGNPNLVNPSENPHAPPPLLTLASDKDTIAIEVELWRGVFIAVDVRVDRGEVPSCVALLGSLDGDRPVVLPLGPTGRAERLLVPGRWEASLVFPAGYLLTDLVHNGESLPGHKAPLDVSGDRRGQALTWTLSAPALITGRVLTEGRPGCAGTVVATLLSPGAWYPGATARGGFRFDRVPAQKILPDCSYSLRLPDGAWRLRPEGSDVIASDPESVDLAIAPGETRTVDFVVRAKTEDGSGAPLRVTVRTPDGRPATRAVVEVWPAGPRGSEARPLRTDWNEVRSRYSEFRGLAPGDYLVVAGHADWLEGSAQARIPDSEKDEPIDVTVTLRPGAILHGRATDASDAPVPEVELRVSRIGDPPESLMDNGDLAAEKAHRRIRTDLTGHAEIGGLPAGTYRVSGRVTGEGADARFVRIRRHGQDAAPEIEVRLGEVERVELEMLVLPAASLTGTLVCSDGGGLPARASFRLYPVGDAPPEPWADRELREGAVLAFDDLRLGGENADRFRVGPLPPNPYRVAARPAGFDYWSWIADALEPHPAAIVHVEGVASKDIGIAVCECGPVVRVEPKVRSGEPLPDFRLTTVEAVAIPADGRQTAFTFETDKHEARAFLRKLPEGKFKLSVVVKHPYLIPPSLALPEVDVDLVRGTQFAALAAFEKVGGLLEVRGAAATARLASTEGDPVIRPVADGKASFPGTAPGFYRVDLCEDRACARVLRSWERVEVIGGRTVAVGPGE